MDVNEYLKHIHCEDLKDKKPNLENLTTLQKRHFEHISFENFDIHMGKHIEYNLQDTYDRIMKRQRGGWCIQLNRLFCWLLTQLGYKCYITRVFIYNFVTKQLSDIAQHMVCICEVDGVSYYVDVGTPRLVNEPIEIKVNEVQRKPFGTYNFHREGDFVVFKRTKWIASGDVPEDEWLLQFKFQLVATPEDICIAMNELCQSSAYPSMYNRTFCAKHVNDGIIWISGNTLTEFKFTRSKDEDGGWLETRRDTQLTDEEVMRHVKETFGIVVDTFKPFDNYSHILKS